MYSPGTGGFYRGGQGGQRPQGMAGRLRSSLDATDRDDALGKVYDTKVIKRLPKYIAWVKKYLALAGIGTILRTFTNIAIPFVVAIVTNNYIQHHNVNGLNIAVLVYVGWLYYCGPDSTWRRYSFPMAARASCSRCATRCSTT